MKATVVIPTYKREESLLRTLKSLDNQTVSGFDILVVDNAAETSVEESIERFNESANNKVQYIAHDTGGSSGARNRGALESKGDVLIYTDDDLTFDETWLESYLVQFERHPEMTAASGRVKPIWEGPPPEWLISYIGNRKVFGVYALIDRGEHFLINDDNILFSCNMAIRRSVFKTKKFHPELFGSKTLGDGESGLSQDLIREGELIGYVPGAVAFHHIPVHRMTIAYIRKWAWHLGGALMYRRWRNRRRTYFNITREVLGILLRYIPTWIRAVFVHKNQDRNSIDVLFKSSLGICKIKYVWWMLTDPLVQEILDET